MIVDSLTGVLTANALIVAFVFVGILVWLSYRLSNALTRARDAVIDNMVANDFITYAQGEAAKAEELRTANRSEVRQVAPEVMIAARDGEQIG